MPDSNDIAPPPIFDVHAHSEVEPWRRAMAKAGRPVSKAWSAEAMVAAMDEHGIATTVLSLPIPIDFAGGEARSLARAINEGHAEIKARFPGRFGAYAVVPGNDPDGDLAETAYALDVLGLDGVCTSSNIAGVYMGDAAFDPWFAEMNRRAVTLFIHPNLPKVWVNMGVHVSIVEFMADTTRAVANLVYSGAKQRFPDIKMISTHGGGTTPFLAQRLAWLQEQYGPGPGRAKLSAEEVMQALGSFYYDLTASTAPAQLNALLKLVPHTQLLMGFDMPYMDEVFIEPAKRQFFAYSGLTAAQKRDICQANAQALFPSLTRQHA